MMNDKTPSPWDQAAIRTADARKQENTGRRKQAAPARRGASCCCQA